MISISIQIPEESKDSIKSDYELIKSIYENEINEISFTEEKLSFIIKLKYEINVNNSTIDLLSKMKMEDLIIGNDIMFLPFWIEFSYDNKTRVLISQFFIYWIRNNKEIIDNLNKNISEVIEPYIYNIIETSKISIENSISKDNLLNLISEIKEMNIINKDMSTENFLFIKSGANKDLIDFRYESPLKNHNKLNINNINSQKGKNITISNKENIEKEENSEEENSENSEDEENSKKNNLYNEFFKSGGIVGETIIDRASVFQAHAIKIHNKTEIQLYRSYLLSQRKIKRATHNISAYRFINSNNEIEEDFDDDGEDEAGIRLLGIIKKMKFVNLFVNVTRWYGGILLHLDRFKRICDSAKFLLKDNEGLFDKC